MYFTASLHRLLEHELQLGTMVDSFNASIPQSVESAQAESAIPQDSVSADTVTSCSASPIYPQSDTVPVVSSVTEPISYRYYQCPFKMIKIIGMRTVMEKGYYPHDIVVIKFDSACIQRYLKQAATYYKDSSPEEVQRIMLAVQKKAQEIGMKEIQAVSDLYVEGVLGELRGRAPPEYFLLV